MKQAFLRKALSRCKAYAEDFMLACLIYDIAKTKQVVSICNVAERKHISAEVVSVLAVVVHAYPLAEHPHSDLNLQRFRRVLGG